jgi:GMP synthase (glutamine-hydrolysing)
MNLMKRKVLVYNCMEFPKKIRMFRDGIEKEVEAVGIDSDFVIPLNPEALNRVDEFSHLIISGSEASAMNESLWTDELTALISKFVSNDKKILGICYGHEFLASVFCGKNCLFTLPIPEYGYSKVMLKENRLFENITSPVCLQLHHDAVRNPGKDFEIIAENETSLQAFQYKGKDIFGVQFHPEFDFKTATYFFDAAAKKDPGFQGYFKNELGDHKVLEQNRLVIQNFLKL